METLSVVISAYNEALKLPRVLTSISWADEIIVIDNDSSDETATIAKKFNAKVITKANNPMLNENKNFGFDQATKSWILNLDGDEEVPESLAAEIKKKIHENSEINGYWISRKNIIFGKWIEHGLWWPDKQLRLFKKGKGKFPCEHIHEYLKVEGNTASLQEPFIHHNYESISQFLRKLDTLYTENEVVNLMKKNYELQWFDAIRMPISDFVKVYFAQAGYKDGLHGLVLAILQAFYAFIVFAKVWEKKQFVKKEISLQEIQKELFHTKKEVSYWEKTVELEETKQPITKILIKLHRKYVSTH